jgi:hypothetical protein
MAVASATPLTATGVDDEVCIIPFPNCPTQPSPQHTAEPSATLAHVWRSPAAIAVAPVTPLTATGVDESVRVPFPNCPAPLNPQHVTAPPVTIAHVWKYPTVTAVAPVRPVTATSVDEAMVVPFPNCP